MSVTWNDNAPIYLQLRDRVVAMILDGVLKHGDALPSVRQVAADFHAALVELVFEQGHHVADDGVEVYPGALRRVPGVAAREVHVHVA